MNIFYLSNMLQALRKLIYPSFTPLNTITVSKQAILGNIEYLSSLHKGSDIFPVIKSNAYGHGLKEICEILNASSVHTVCMDSTYEYQVVKKYFKWNMIMLWETHSENYLGMDPKRVAVSVYNISTLEALVKTKKKFKVHIFCNTGMNREGIQSEQIEEFCSIIKNSNLVFEGIVSHFSSADDSDNSVTHNQIEKFKDMAQEIWNMWLSPKYKYISASGGSLKVQDRFLNAIKPGLACYGYNPLLPDDADYEKGSKLVPALDIYSTVTSIQSISPSDGVGYNQTYSPMEPTRVASIPFGYTEGLDRRLSNNWQVKIWETYYPVRWRVSMNIVTIEIWDEDIAIWDRVQIISSNPDDKNSISAGADAMGTIDYEVLVKLDPSVVREII